MDPFPTLLRSYPGGVGPKGPAKGERWPYPARVPTRTLKAEPRFDGKGPAMKRQQWGLYAVALAILVVGLVWAGVPASTLLIAALVLVCPLMMFFMMRGMDHGGHGDGRHHATPDDPHPAERNDRQEVHR